MSLRLAAVRGESVGHGPRRSLRRLRIDPNALSCIRLPIPDAFPARGGEKDMKTLLGAFELRACRNTRARGGSQDRRRQGLSVPGALRQVFRRYRRQGPSRKHRQRRRAGKGKRERGPVRPHFLRREERLAEIRHGDRRHHPRQHHRAADGDPQSVRQFPARPRWTAAQGVARRERNLRALVARCLRRENNKEREAGVRLREVSPRASKRREKSWRSRRRTRFSLAVPAPAAESRQARSMLGNRVEDARSLLRRR